MAADNNGIGEIKWLLRLLMLGIGVAGAFGASSAGSDTKDTTHDAVIRLEEKVAGLERGFTVLARAIREHTTGHNSQ